MNNSTNQDRPTPAEAANTTPADRGCDIVWEWRYAASVVRAFAKRDDLTDAEAWQSNQAVAEMEHGHMHQVRLTGDRSKADGRWREGYHGNWFWEQPCCSHVEDLEREVAALREELADTKAALAVADGALDAARPRWGRRRQTALAAAAA